MTKPSWENAPDWAQWLARDADGEWCWYEARPKIQTGDTYWTRDDVNRWAVAGKDQWEETLEERRKPPPPPTCPLEDWLEQRRR